MPRSRLNHDGFLSSALLFSLFNSETRSLCAFLSLFFDVKELSDISDHVWQLSLHLKLLLVLSDSSIIQSVLLVDTGHCLPIAAHVSLHIANL
jgi:hypothetical protein